jgi:hypothetical protein
MKIHSRNAAASAVLACAFAAVSPAHALDVAFTIQGDPALAGTNLYNTPWVSGDVTGILHGLTDNASGQMPTFVELTSGYQSLGVTQSIYNPSNWYLGGAGSLGLTVAGGNIVGGGLKITLSETATYRGTMLVIDQPIDNTIVYNALTWYFGAGPYAGKGNKLGSAGITFSPLSAVPEPGNPAMWLAGSGVLAWLLRRRGAASW